MKFKKFAIQWERLSLDDYQESYHPTVLGILKKHLVPFFGENDIKKINVMDVEMLKAKVSKDGLAPSTIRSILNILSRMFSDAVLWEKTRRNPVDGVKRPKDKKTPEEFDNYIDSRDDLRKLLQSADSMGSHIGTFIWLTVRLGCRSGEIRALDKFRDLDFENNTIKLSKKVYMGQEGLPKGKKTRVIQLLPEEMERVRAQASKHPESSLLFPSKSGKPLSHVTPNRWLEDACIKAGIARVTLHGLRHTAGTMMIRNGVSAEQAAHFLGHASTNTTKRYVHLTGADAAQAGLVLSGAINGK